MPTRVFACRECGHAQSPELPDVQNFYDTQYKISLESEDHDQLFGTVDGKPIYRTDVQAQIVLDMFPLKSGAKVLDYGAAKAATLKKVLNKRPDIVPHVFDVSNDYRKSWSSWLPDDACASYELRPEWTGRFNLITTHYVMEHVPGVVAALSNLKSYLAPDGAIFFSVPDWEANPGDLLVADHVNHFCETSIRRAVREAGMMVVRIARDMLPTAFTVVCVPDGVEPMPAPGDVAKAVAIAQDVCGGLSQACDRLDRDMAANRGRKSAIFGAGFYGMFLHTRASGKIEIACFADSNSHLWQDKMYGLDVFPPAKLPTDIEVVYVGLNPTRARDIAKNIPALQREGLKLVFIDIAA